MQEAEQIIEAVEAMTIRGAYLNAVRALEALVLLTKEASDINGVTLQQDLLFAAERLASANPSWAVVGTACSFTTAPLREQPDRQWEVYEIQEMISTRARIFEEGTTQAQDTVTDVGARVVQDGSTIILMSYSLTMVEMLRKAWESGKRFSVIGTESRPNYEGHEMAERIVKIGVPYTLITDAALSHFVEGADMGLIGVDTLLGNGDVINKIGTLPMALACKFFGKPLYAITSSFKISIPSLNGERVGLKVVDDVAGIAPDELLDYQNLRVENLFFEVTPAHLFAGLISEYGVYPVTAARLLWERTWARLNQAAAGQEAKDD